MPYLLILIYHNFSNLRYVKSFLEQEILCVCISVFCRWEHLIYQFGCHDKIIDYVIKKGHIAHTKYECCG